MMSMLWGCLNASNYISARLAPNVGAQRFVSRSLQLINLFAQRASPSWEAPTSSSPPEQSESHRAIAPHEPWTKLWVCQAIHQPDAAQFQTSKTGLPTGTKLQVDGYLTTVSFGFSNIECGSISNSNSWALAGQWENPLKCAFSDGRRLNYTRASITFMPSLHGNRPRNNHLPDRSNS